MGARQEHCKRGRSNHLSGRLVDQVHVVEVGGEA
jgi:hypothetical protein